MTDSRAPGTRTSQVGFPPSSSLHASGLHPDAAELGRQPGTCPRWPSTRIVCQPLFLWVALSLVQLPLDWPSSAASQSAAAAEPPPSLTATLEDARLRAVSFTDPDRGWAVGDRGVIWRTVDGGRSWELQPSDVHCSLLDVFFLDSRHGWIVGGWTHPYTHQTTGVVLRTQDSGETWVHVPGMILPRLHRVRFFSAREGIALGASSALFPSGIFRTIDGGRSWNLVPGSEPRHTTTGDVIDMQSGALAGPRGELVALTYGRSAPSRTPRLGERDLHDLRLHDMEGWLVGDGGLAMRSRDGGASWQFPEGRLPAGAEAHFDFRAVATLDQHVWIVGSPGSIVFHSPDRGGSWQRMPTDQTLPLDGLTFLDRNRGWAVGALGTILATRDGGRTWRRQRGGGNRAALLGFFREPESTPWELYAWYSANEGYIGVLEHLNRREVVNPSPLIPPAARRSEEALVAVGGSAAETAWNFPLPRSEVALSSDQVWRNWDLANDGQGRQRMLEYLVRRIRQWRPEIVVTEDAGKEADSAGHEINQLVLAAVQQAADPTAHADHLTLAGLEPWQVKKAFSHMRSSGMATQRLSSSQLATNLAASLDDFTAYGRGLIFSEFLPPPAQTELRLLVNLLPSNVSQADLFAGLTLPPGGGARRRPGEQPPINLDSLSRITRKRRNLEQLIALDRSEPAGGTAWLGQLDELTRGFTPSMAGSMLYQLAIRYHRQGQTALAADALQQLVELHPDHALADSALLWLVRYYGSSEVSWHLRQQTFYHEQVVHADVDPHVAAARRAGLQVDLGPRSPVVTQQDGVAGLAGGEGSLEKRSRRAMEIASLVSRTRPGLFADPAIRFPLAAAQRTVGNARDAEQFFHHVASVGLSPGWRSAAQGELWLRHAVGNPPRPAIVCHKAQRKPRLDGELNDDLWQDIEPVELSHESASNELGTSLAMFAHDQEFLYIAVRCEYAARGDYTRSDAPRPRDADLSRRDRVEILLDCDRDYATYFRLVVDHRGWTFEDCWGDSSWNPRWFVAGGDDGVAWTIELAIPWSELVSQPPTPRSSWAVGIQRIVPDLGFQSWSQPAAIDVIPEGFGLLLFQ